MQNEIILEDNKIYMLLDNIFEKDNYNKNKYLPKFKEYKNIIKSINQFILSFKIDSNSEENKIKILKIFKKIIQNSPELGYYFINKNLLNLNDSLLEILIDNYLQTKNEKYIETLENFFTNLLSILTINKPIYDYIYKIISKQYEKFDSNLFIKQIDLLNVFYGKNAIKYSNTFLPKNYFYFKNSGHLINLLEQKNFKLEFLNGFIIVIWFYLESFNQQNEQVYLIELNGEEEIIKIKLDNTKICFIYNGIDYDEMSINIVKDKWIQLHLILDKKNNSIMLNVYYDKDNNDKIINNKNNNYSKRNKNIKEKKDKNIHNDDKFSKKLNISNIKANFISMVFFNEFIGKFTSILILSNFKKYQDKKMKLLYGIHNIKLFNKFINEKKDIIDNNCLLIAPFTCNNITNTLIDPINNIKGNINLDNFNNIYHYKNNIKNINKIGGSINILPLFEILLLNSNDSQSEKILINIFNLLNNIIIDKEKNFTEFHSSKFFEILSIILINIPNELFANNKILLIHLIGIGQQIKTNLDKKKDYKSNDLSFYKNILFNVEFLKKFSIENLNILWKNILTGYNDSKIDFIDMIMNIEDLVNLLLYLSKNNNINEDLNKILKKVFYNVNVDEEERGLIFEILYKKEEISDNLVINILNVLIEFFDLKNKEKNEIYFYREKNLYYLFEKKNFFEVILYLLTCDNLEIKLLVVELIKIIYADYINCNDYYYKIFISKHNFLKKNDKNEIKLFIEKFIKKNIIFNLSNKLIDYKEKKNENIFKDDSFLDINEKEITPNPSKHVIINFPSDLKTKTNNDKNKIRLHSKSFKLPKLKNNILNKSFEKKESNLIEEPNESEKSSVTVKNKNKKKIIFDITKIKKKKKKKKEYSKSCLNLYNILNLQEQEKILFKKEKEKTIKKFKSEKIIHFNYSSLKINTELINKENEIHIQNFNQKIFLLSKHCVDFIEGKDTKSDCKKEIFDIHKHNNNINYENNINNYNSEDENKNNNIIIEDSDEYKGSSLSLKKIDKEKEEFQIKEYNINTFLNELNINQDERKYIETKLNEFEENKIKVINQNKFLYICSFLNNWDNDAFENNENDYNFFILKCLFQICEYTKNLKIIQHTLNILDKKINSSNCNNNIYIILFKNKFLIKTIIKYIFISFMHLKNKEFKSNYKYFDENIYNKIEDIYNKSNSIFNKLFEYNIKKYNEKNIKQNYYIFYLLSLVLNYYSRYENYVDLFLSEFMKNIINIYHKPIISKNNINEKIIINYIEFISIFYEYCFIIKRIFKLNENISDISNPENSNILSYLCLGIRNYNQINNGTSIWSDFYLYDIIYQDIMKIIGLKLRNKYNKKLEKTVISFDIQDFDDIIDDNLPDKDKKFNLFFKYFFNYYNFDDKNINIKELNAVKVITIFNVLFFFQTDFTKENIELIKKLLNNFQFFLIFCIIAYHDGFKKNEEKNQILFIVISFSLDFITNLLISEKSNENSKIKDYIKNVVSNVFIFIIKIKKENEFIIFKSLIEEKMFFKIHNNNHQDITFSDFILMNSKEIKNQINNNKIIKEKINNNLFNKDLLKNLIDFRIKSQYLIKKKEYCHYYNIYEKDINKKLLYIIFYKNLLKYKNENIKQINLNISNLNMKKIFHIKKLKKKYRNIKKNLFSWNGSYSDLDLFYTNKKTYQIKYKILNHYSKTFSMPILIPIYDFNYYLLKFSSYNEPYDMFKKNFRDNFYQINLNFLPTNEEEKENNKNQLKNFFNNKCYSVCFVKISHHIKGEINIQSKDNKNKIIFISYNKEIYNELDEDYDNDKKTCFGSILHSNVTPKDLDTFISLNINKINFIFLRKYFYRNNAIEIYTSINKSYFFKFLNEIERNEFINNVIKYGKNLKEIKNYKNIIIGYFNSDINNLNEYSSMKKIQKLWKNKTISNFEFLMWINIYSNRSFRDIIQYPVMPWILKNYSQLNIKNENDIENYLLYENLRDLSIPIGMLELNEKGKNRKKIYLDNYLTMIDELNNVYKLDFQNDSKDNFIIDIEKLYLDSNLDYDLIPYMYGSHYNNSIYTSHYLTRIFPFSFLAIELQGNSFDAPERLFNDIGISFNNASSEKCDIRELIPEMYYLPELFININNLNLGHIYFHEQLIEVGNVNLPDWSNKNPYIFIAKIMEIFENEKINIGDWINLIFGINQIGKNSIKKHNLFLPYCYDNVMDNRLQYNYNNILEKEELNSQLRFCEFGLNPIISFNKELDNKSNQKDKFKDNNIIDNIMNIKNYELINNNIQELQNKELYFYTNDDLIYVICHYNFNIFQKIKLKFEYNNNLKIDSKEDINLFTQNKLNSFFKKILMISFDNNYFIFSGFYDGSLYIYNLKEKFAFERKIYYLNKINYDNSIVTFLTINKSNEYLFVGTEIGNIIIYKLNIKKKFFIDFYKILTHHIDAVIYLNVNDNLNLFGSLSLDNYLNIYTIPKFQMTLSLFLNENINYDYLLLSSNPLPCFLIYSNSNKILQFKIYSINGEFIKNEENKIDVIEYDDEKLNNKKFISPIVYTNYNFMDYLIYGYIDVIVVRKFPLMEIYNYITIPHKIKKLFIKYIIISSNKKCIYIINNEGNIFFKISKKKLI